MKCSTLCFFMFLYNCCLAQSDTSVVYLAKDGHETNKDSAFSKMQFYKQNNVWHGKEVYVKNGILKSEGDYAVKSAKEPIGNFNNYTETGKLDFTASYINGKPVEATYYYKSGSKKSWATFDDKGIKQQKGWDETGKEIKNFIVMKEAGFKGGIAGWTKYLEKNLNPNVAIDAGVLPGEYTVEVTFKVSSLGYVSNVKAKSVPAKCKPCGSEAVRVILSSPEWQPAIMQNEPVDYLALQLVKFVVADDKKKK